MRTRPLPTRPVLGVLAALLVTLAGCVKVDADLSIEGDTVTGTLLTALDKQAAELLELDPADLFGAENDQFASLEGVTSQPYDDGTWAGTELTFDQVSIDELNQLSDGDPDGLRILRDGTAGSYEFSMVLDLAWMADLADEQPADPDVDVAALLDGFEATVAVRFPDQVTEHNGQLSGSTVSWSPQPGERNELRAVALGYQGSGDPATPAPTGSPAGDQPADPASPGDPAATERTDQGGVPAWPLVLAAGLLAVAAAAAAGWWFYLRPRRAGQPEPAPGGNPPDGNPPAGPPVE
jgi:hypothetical protein